MLILVKVSIRIFIILGNSVWTEMQNNTIKMSVDFKQMEELFCQRTAPAKRPKSSPGNLPSPASPEINLLDNKRSLAVNIFLKQFKGGGKDIIAAIKEFRGEFLGVEKLRALFRLLPDENEVCN